MIDETLLSAILDGDRKSIARAISVIEKGGPEAVGLLQAIYGHTGTAHRVGITGPPGSGKSTLINQLVAHFRENGKSVAVMAIDPTSPYSQGALLGDRIRMTRAGEDAGVFIRSMASRGAHGGLSDATHDAADILDAAGFDVILIETTGVGQVELDIASMVDSVMILVVPESGDSVQAMKAGLMEIADFFVLNKCDRPGSDSAFAAMQSVLDLRPPPRDEWRPGIFRTSATEGQGTAELAAKVPEHRSHLVATGRLQQRREQRLRSHVTKIVEKLIVSELWDEASTAHLDLSLRPVLDGELSPYDLARLIVSKHRRREF